MEGFELPRKIFLMHKKINMFSAYFTISITYAENLIRLAYSVGLLLYANKILPEDEFASFAFYMSLAVVIYGVSKLSLDSYATKELVSTGFSRSKKVLTRLMLARALYTCIILVIVLCLLIFFDSYDGYFFSLLALQVFRSADSVEWFLRAEMKMAYQAIIRIVAIFFAVIFLSSYVFYGDVLSKEVFVYTVSLEWLIQFMLYVCYVFYNFRGEAFGFIAGESYEKEKNVIKKSIPVYCSFVLFLFYSKVDQLVLKKIVGHGDYANYMIAARLNEASLIVVTSLTMFLFPKLVRSHKESVPDFERKISRYSWGYLLLSFIVIFIVFLVSYYHEFYPGFVKSFIPEGAVRILPYFILSTILLYLFALRSSYFVIINNSSQILIGAILGFGFSISIGIVLMINYGVFGGVASYIGAAFFSLCFSNFFTNAGRRYMKIIFKRGAF